MGGMGGGGPGALGVSDSYSLYSFMHRIRVLLRSIDRSINKTGNGWNGHGRRW